VSLQKNNLKVGDIGPSLLTKQDALQRISADPGPIETLFFSGSGRSIHKWIHYLRVYDELFAAYRSHAIMLEIGIAKGGSLDLWRNYFGSGAVIFGIDIDSECRRRVSPPNEVRIGSQTDSEFLARVVAEMGPPNIILDDRPKGAIGEKAIVQEDEGGRFPIAPEAMPVEQWIERANVLNRFRTNPELREDPFFAAPLVHNVSAAD
jgi:hypothetical protein